MPSSGGVRLSGGPVLSEAELSMLDSDVSSVIEISDALVASDTDDGDALHDRNKYRLPDVGKTRLHLLTKEPLSPTPRRGPMLPETPPGTSHSNVSGLSLVAPLFPQGNWSNENVSDSDWAGSGLSRAGSIYTLGRTSLQGQLAQLTSLKLPHADSLAKRISSIPNSTDAAKALSDAAEQIRLWINKSSDVLNGLNAEDDVEWAAAGGREGIEDVDKAINRFERLVHVYIFSVEKLQSRDDVSELSTEELQNSLQQVEGVIASWQKVKDNLSNVKDQVEVALEWEELWNSVLGEVAQEMEGLSRLVFEMEEKRHQGAESLLSSKDSIDLTELETIVEERPRKGETLNPDRHHFAMPSLSLTSAVASTQPDVDKEDSSLVALFARMQPLRASLDFLPMKLSTFRVRAGQVFPSACLDVEQRRDQLEAQWQKLEGDAESLRRELGEDRWVLVFRNAGRQAMKMCESISRSYYKLQESLDCSEHQPTVAQKIASYEAKKTHYGPAIERVLAIIDRGVRDRLTVNGEVLRLQSDTKRRWTALQADIRDMDMVLEDINSDNHDQQLVDSISTVMSSERSVGSSLVETPGSSPASSVIGASRKSSFQGSRTPTPLTNARTRPSSFTTNSNARPGSRLSSASSIPRRIPLTHTLSPGPTRSASPSPLTTRSNGRAASIRPDQTPSSRPRWRAVTKADARDFKSLSSLEPSPYAKKPVAKHTNFLRSSSTPMHNPKPPDLRQTSTPSSVPALHTPSTLPQLSTPSQRPARKSSLPIPNSAPATTRTTLAAKRSSTALRTPSAVSARQSNSFLEPPTDGNEADNESPSHHKSRPPSVLANGRGSSILLRRPTSRLDKPDIMAGAPEKKPVWRP